MKKVRIISPNGTHKLEDSLEGATNRWRLTNRWRRQTIRATKAMEWFVGALVLLVNFTLADVVETLDAQTYEGRIARLDAQGLTIKTADGETTLKAENLANILLQPSSDLLKTPGQAVVLTRAGDVLSARELRIDADNLHFITGKNKTPSSLPLGLIGTILLPAPGQSPEDVQRICDEIQCTAGANDVLVIVSKDGTPQKVSGTLVGMAEKKITFMYQKKERTVGMDRVRAIRLARPGPAAAPPRMQGRLETTDGRVYVFASVSLPREKYVLQQGHGREVNLPREDVSKITFRSDRVTFLSDLKPASVREHGLFDKVIPHRVNRSAGGGALHLAGRQYETGLGLHSFCELTYDLGGGYRAFVATAGIDDAVRPNGVATLTILGDAKPLLPATTLTGRDAPKPVHLDVSGVKTLTIRVEFGPDRLDVSDHVDLAGARLVK